MTIELTILISVISVCATLIFGIANWKKSNDSNVEARTEQITEIRVKVEEALNLLKSMQDELKNLIDRVTEDEKKTDVLYAKVESMERRIDRLEKGGKA